MSDDGFFREVNEELRQERARALWGRFGPALIALAVLLVLATGIFQGYRYWQSQKADRIGDRFLQALDLANDTTAGKAIEKLDEVERSDFGAYPSLAAMRLASIKKAQGDSRGALQAFDQIAADPSTPVILQKIAKVRAAYILVDTGSVQDVEQRVKDLATDIDPLRLSAREAIGLAEWKAGNSDEAVHYFSEITQEGSSGLNVAARAQMMLDLIASHSKDKNDKK